MDETTNYWNKFYSDFDRKLLLPSQFAAFIATEYVGVMDTIVDLGCGNGRDSRFFRSIGFNVVGIDASGEAIDLAKKNLGSDAYFYKANISDSAVIKLIAENIATSTKRLIYSRFFLHAISDEAEVDFWQLCVGLCTPGSCVAIEFRTHRDEKLSKATHQHFRRFINPTDLLERASLYGFKCQYLVEGFGYAKYNSDDAHIARVIFRR